MNGLSQKSCMWAAHASGLHELHQQLQPCRSHLPGLPAQRACMLNSNHKQPAPEVLLHTMAAPSSSRNPFHAMQPQLGSTVHETVYQGRTCVSTMTVGICSMMAAARCSRVLLSTQSSYTDLV